MKLYNTMSRRLEEFTPAGDEVKIYVCGVTPYDRAHLAVRPVGGALHGGVR